MTQAPPPPRTLRFGPFEFDPESGELRSEGGTQFLADQPLALLNALLERPSEMVSRETLRGRLWPDGTFVDFDHGLNSAVSRLREALNDSANTPRFVETIPRRGYRLLGPVEFPLTIESTASVPLPEADKARPPVGRAGREAAAEWLTRWHTVASAGLVVTGLFLAWIAGVIPFRREARPVPLTASVVIDLPDEWAMLNQSPAISPDSRHIVFSGWHSRRGRRAIWLRPLDTGSARMLPGTDDGNAPFWSPDGESIGFFAGGKLKVLQLTGTSAQVIADAPPDATDASGAWISRDVIIFAPGLSGTVSVVSVDRRTVRPITTLDRSTGEIRHIRPTSLADGRHFIYLAEGRNQLVATLASLDGSRRVPLGPVRSQVEATQSGHVVFVRDGSLLAQRLDVEAGRLTGNAIVLAEGLTRPGLSFDGRFSTSPDMLVYLKASERSDSSELGIFDRMGKMIGTVGEPAAYMAPSLSPDGTRLAVARHESDAPGRDIWVFDLARGTRLRLTLDPGDDLSPRWSADGRRLMFTSDRRGVRDLYMRLASGEGADELVYESEVNKSLQAWSRDERFVVYDTGGVRGGPSDLYALPLSGARRPVVLASQQGLQQQAEISPDGRRLAYGSSESGKWEVIVQSFPENGGRWQVSTNGGREPAWRGDGRELFFLSGDTVMAADVHTGATGFEWSAPRPLFQIPNLQAVPRGLCVSADGQRFVAVIAKVPSAPQRFSTLMNWTSLVK